MQLSNLRNLILWIHRLYRKPLETIAYPIGKLRLRKASSHVFAASGVSTCANSLVQELVLVPGSVEPGWLCLAVSFPPGVHMALGTHLPRGRALQAP